MSEAGQRPTLGIPEVARDERGDLLPPDRIALGALMDQMECGAMLYDPETPRPVLPDAPIRFARGAVCRALEAVREDGRRCCERDMHPVAHAAMASGAPATGDCIGGEGLLYACPIVLHHGGSAYPKAAVCGAVHDVYHFHYADRLTRVLGRPVAEVQDLLCETDKRSLNARQLRMIRRIMQTQAEAFSRLISERYAELEFLSFIARQRDELNRANELMDTECRLVGEIQRRLVPHAAPPIAGFETATHYVTAHRAGGDYFDFLPRADGAWGVILADVSGHGPPAAVVTAMIRSLLHAMPADIAEPSAVLGHLNRHLGANIMLEQFVTVFFVVVHPGGRLETSCSAHPSPLLYRAADGRVEQIQTPRGLPLGIAEDSTFPAHEMALAPGDVLLLFTDGLPETFDAEDRILGLEPLADAVRRHAADGAEAVRDAVIAAARRHAGPRPIEDDQTLIVLRRRAWFMSL